jgi:hypothetical protein
MFCFLNEKFQAISPSSFASETLSSSSSSSTKDEMFANGELGNPNKLIV